MQVKRILDGAICLALCAALGCGTILYPERRGQRAGQVDAGIVLLDAVGLLIFFVPGVIAFAVDFSTGAIYLPRGQKSRLLDVSGPDRSASLEIVPLRERSIAALEASLREHRGIDVDLRADARWIEPAISVSELPGFIEALDREADRADPAAR